jgi:aspartate/glutamate racemase
MLGFTELELLIGPRDAPVAVFDTIRIHAESAVSWHSSRGASEL